MKSNTAANSIPHADGKKGQSSLMAKRALARMSLVPALLAHAMSNQRLRHSVLILPTRSVTEWPFGSQQLVFRFRQFQTLADRLLKRTKPRITQFVARARRAPHISRVRIDCIVSNDDTLVLPCCPDNGVERESRRMGIVKCFSLYSWQLPLLLGQSSEDKTSGLLRIQRRPVRLRYRRKHCNEKSQSTKREHKELPLTVA